MNSVFDLKRWLLFTGKYWNENKKKYLLGMGALVALLVIWFFLVLMIEARTTPFPYPMQSTTYFVGLFIIGLLMSSLMFGDLADAPKGIHYLMIPASHFEKLLTGILFSTVLFFICYTLIFYSVDFIMIQVANSLEYKYVANSAGKPHVQEMVNLFSYNPDQDNKAYNFFFMIYLWLQPAFLLGSVYFARYSFIKTAISLMLIFLCLMFLTVQVLSGMFPKGAYLETAVQYHIPSKGTTQVVALPRWIGETCVFILKYSLVPFFLLVAYFRLKEKEV